MSGARLDPAVIVGRTLREHSVAGTSGFGVEQIACRCEATWVACKWRTLDDYYVHLTEVLCTALAGDPS